ncbi:ATP-binding protein [Planctomycetota bacterium]
MNVKEINTALSTGNLDNIGLFPHLDELRSHAVTFDIDFGLQQLPRESGILCIRGPRQYGKSTWLEAQLRQTVETYGPGSAFYLNGDDILNHQHLSENISDLIPLYATQAPIKRLFIDEITAIDKWEQGLKRLVDTGRLRDILVITTGSKATDLRRGTERLPGRKGKLERTDFYFTPLSYTEFKRVCGQTLGNDTLVAYLISGGSPMACVELYTQARLPEYIVNTTRDWILGEFAASGRARSSLAAILRNVIRFGCVPLGHAKLARESGLANNTVASGYIELLSDLVCVTATRAWDPAKQVPILRKPAKFHFVNCLAAVAWSPQRIRTVADFHRLAPGEQGIWFEWLVAQELVRQASIQGAESPELLYFWQSKSNEIDFLVNGSQFIEVKRGTTSPVDFTWFSKVFPNQRLHVISQSQYNTEAIVGMHIEDFLTRGTLA